MTASYAAIELVAFDDALSVVLTPYDFHPILVIANRNDEFLTVRTLQEIGSYLQQEKLAIGKTRGRSA